MGVTSKNKETWVTETLYKPVPFAKMMDGPTTIEWIVDEVVPQTTTGIIAGEPGVGKTWIIMDMILAIASGVKWLGKYNTRVCKILVVDEENAHVLIRQRYLSLVWKYQKYGRLKNIDFLVGESVDITPLEHPRKGMEPSSDYMKLYNTVGEGEYDLVVFDSLTRVHHSDENDSSRMSAVFGYIKNMMDAFGVSCIFTHHFNKSRGHNNNRLRGSSDILAFPDYVLRVETDRGHNGIGHNGVVIEHGKSRWGTNIGKLYARLEDHESGNKEIVRIKTQDLINAILTYVAVARTRSDIVEEMHRKGLGEPSTVDRQLKELTKERKIFKPTNNVYQATGAAQYDDLGSLM